MLFDCCCGVVGMVVYFMGFLSMMVFLFGVLCVCWKYRRWIIVMVMFSFCICIRYFFMGDFLGLWD